MASPLYSSEVIVTTFRKFQTRERLSSYEVLLQVPGQIDGLTILDLPCGSGFLSGLADQRVGKMGRVIGIDADASEIAFACARTSAPNIEFRCERAQDLTLPKQSIDVVYCHLGLMVFDPIEPVIEKIASVLKPGGYFIANRIAMASHAPIFEKYLAVAQEYEHHIPDLPGFRWGDPRINSDDGLKELFPEQLGFASRIDTFRYAVTNKTEPETMRNMLRPFFQISYLLPDTDRHVCDARLLGVLREFATDDGIVEFSLPLERVIIRKERAVDQ